MFRNALSEMGLSSDRQASAPRPTFRPALEALEERTMLHGDMGMDMPAQPPVLSQEAEALQQFTSALQTLQASLQFRIKVAKGAALLSRDPAKLEMLEKRTRGAGKALRLFQQLATQLEQSHGTSDPNFNNNLNAFKATAAAFQKVINKAEDLSLGGSFGGMLLNGQ